MTIGRKQGPLFCAVPLIITFILFILLPGSSYAQQIRTVPLDLGAPAASGSAAQMPQQQFGKPELPAVFEYNGQPKDGSRQAAPGGQGKSSADTISEFEKYIAGCSFTRISPDCLERCSSFGVSTDCMKQCSSLALTDCMERIKQPIDPRVVPSPIISTNIRQFGYNLFGSPPSTFAPEDKTPVGPDYVIGPGDEIKITIWGKIDGRWTLVVDRDGIVNIPKVGMIGVAGLSFRELKDALQNEISKNYTGFEMNVSMGSLRSIRVYMVGSAHRPGAYTISSFSTLVNALFAAGGPSKTGSMRDIQVKRNGRTVTHFDMYDFLLKGDKSKDVRLMPEDVIFIPPIGPLVAVAGNVKNPAIYEMKNETKLLDVIRMTGGLGSVAFKGRVQVMRIDGLSFRSIFEGELTNLGKDPKNNFALKDGDLLKIFTVVEKKTIVTVAGAVAMPGEFGVNSAEMRIKDVIARAGGLQYYAADKAELTRLKVTQSGPVTELMIIDLTKALKGDDKHNLKLELNDYLLVRTVPEWDLNKIVDIHGEVKYPGKYSIRRGERLSSVIERAGGYTEKAYLLGSFFTRLSVKELQQKGLDDMITRLERELLSESSVQIVGTTANPSDMQNQKAALEARQKFIEILRKQKAIGRMTIRLAAIAGLKKSEYDIEMEDGDYLLIPRLNSVVNVTGAVMSPSSHIYSQKYDYKDYIEMSGSYSQNADAGNTYVIKADGSARKLSRGLFSWSNSRARWEYGADSGDMSPGDTIVVPENLERIVWLREIKDITQTLMQIAVSAGVFFAMH